MASFNNNSNNNNNNNDNAQNVVVKWITLMRRIRGVQSSNPDPDIGYPD
jgi:hypothetical protein